MAFSPDARTDALMSITEFLRLLTVPPGSLAYHLTQITALVASMVLAYGRYKNTRARANRIAVVGLAAALALELLPVPLAWVGIAEASWLAGARANVVSF